MFDGSHRTAPSKQTYFPSEQLRREKNGGLLLAVGISVVSRTRTGNSPGGHQGIPTSVFDGAPPSSGPSSQKSIAQASLVR